MGNALHVRSLWLPPRGLPHPWGRWLNMGHILHVHTHSGDKRSPGKQFLSQKPSCVLMEALLTESPWLVSGGGEEGSRKAHNASLVRRPSAWAFSNPALLISVWATADLLPGGLPSREKPSTRSSLGSRRHRARRGAPAAGVPGLWSLCWVWDEAGLSSRLI